MSNQKSVCSMRGSFKEPFGGGKYTTFASGGCQYFIAIEQGQKIPVDLEVAAIFELEHKSMIDNGKVAGMLRPSRFVRVDDKK